MNHRKTTRALKDALEWYARQSNGKVARQTLEMVNALSSKQREAMHYFQSLAPVGQWFIHDREKAAAAWGVQTNTVKWRIDWLQSKRYIERSTSRVGQRYLYRVIRPVEMPVKPRRLVKFSGYDARERA